MTLLQRCQPQIVLSCYLCERQHNYPKVIVDIHHKFNVVLGGSDAPENIISLCRQCHRVFEYITNEGSNFFGISWVMLSKLEKK